MKYRRTVRVSALLIVNNYTLGSDHPLHNVYSCQRSLGTTCGYSHFYDVLRTGSLHSYSQHRCLFASASLPTKRCNTFTHTRGSDSA